MFPVSPADRIGAGVAADWRELTAAARDGDPGILAMLARLATEQLSAAYCAARADDPGAAALAAQAARTAQAAADPIRIAFWTDLCAPCTGSFRAWQRARNPDDLSHLPPHAVALAHPSGYDPQVRARAWRETVSHQLLLTRALCTAGRHTPEASS
jgi:hypothetical protein